jgi:hypothetical protein
MYTSSPIAKITKIMGLLIVLALWLTAIACQSIGQLLQPKEEWVELSANDLREILQEPIAGIDLAGLTLKDVSKMELQPNESRAFITYQKEEGTVAEGSLDLGWEIHENNLLVRINGVGIEGVASDNPQISQLSEAITQAVTRAISRDRKGVRFDWIELGNGSIRIKITYQ